jgi:ribosomal protein S18 acetylase RimI-like enzyme
MDQELVIRPAEPKDIPTAEAIAIAAWTPYFAYRREVLGEACFAAAHADWRADKAAQIRSNLQGEQGCRAYVATIDDTVVGFVTFVVDATTGIAEIGNNAVHPDWQSQGIGTRLYTFVLNRMRALGMRYARVQTGGDPAHAPARHAYEKVGFDKPLPHVEYYQAL